MHLFYEAPFLATSHNSLSAFTLWPRYRQELQTRLRLPSWAIWEWTQKQVICS